MSYINRKNTEDAIRKYADTKHCNGEQIEFVNGILKSISVIKEQPSADVVDSAVAKALEEDLERTGNELAKLETERDALLEELQRLADCSSCKFNAPDAVDGCSALMPCKDGSMWEWKGVKNER